MTITGHTRPVGLLGWPVAHSLSPAMHNAAAAALGLDLVYLPLPVRPDAVEAAVRGLPALGFLGANVTVPHKQAVMPYLDEIDPPAQALGAVNTLVVAASPAGSPRLLGYNTDWSGFLADLRSLGAPLDGRETLVLGAGGSARAVAYALATAGARVHLLARRPDQARQVADQLQAHRPSAAIQPHAWETLPAVAAGFSPSLVVNTTPLGMAPQTAASPWPDDVPFPAQALVYDLVYNPAETRLMGQARAAGCQTVNGLGMLLRQGAESFFLWTGRRPDLSVMAAALGRAAAP